MLLLGDCLEQMKTLEANSVDAVVTDPPYGLSKEPDIAEVMQHWINGDKYEHDSKGFMGKSWDSFVPGPEIWREVFRVLKPGGHILCFAGTRTIDLMTVSLRFAGFEIRDQVQWIYGSGFPKSHNVSKAIDKMAGVEREVVGKGNPMSSLGTMHDDNWESDKNYSITAPATPDAKTWDGWGSALKPANEPICLARKPLEKGLTLAENVLKYGTGAINVDGCRIEAKPRKTGTKAFDNESTGSGSSLVGSSLTRQQEYDLKDQGRWPANVLFDEAAAEVLGEPSRFFYVAKASKRERNAGLEGMPLGAPPASARSKPAEGRSSPPGEARANHHPTVKPIRLMEYLITLITPPNGTVLDPFMGSGSTGVASKNLNRNFIGIEMNEEYFEIAQKRIEHVNQNKQEELEVNL